VRKYIGKKLWPAAAKYFPSEDLIFEDNNASLHRADSYLPGHRANSLGRLQAIVTSKSNITKYYKAIMFILLTEVFLVHTC